MDVFQEGEHRGEGCFVFGVDTRSDIPNSFSWCPSSLSNPCVIEPNPHWRQGSLNRQVVMANITIFAMTHQALV